MTTSTGIRTKEEGKRSCPHRSAYPPELLERLHQDCPADLSFWCGSQILAQTRELEAQCQIDGSGYYERLHLRFRGIVEDSLRNCFPGVQVFWATREKPERQEMLSPGEGTRSGSGLVNEVTFDLNRDYHAHEFLAALAQFTVGRSHIFTISQQLTNDRTSFGVRLTCHPLANRDGHFEQMTPWDIDIRFGGECSTAAFCDDLCHNAVAKGRAARAEITQNIKAQIGRWVADAEWPEEAFRTRLASQTDRKLADKMAHDAVERPNEGLDSRYREAVEHLALIAIYQENNGFSAMTYVLAPTIEGASAASLVIYWPQAGEKPLNLLLLLQLILGQNATTILAKDRESREARRLAEARKVALSHYGHTLKHRLDVLSAFLRANAPEAVRLRAMMLEDLTLILQLNAVDNREELCEGLPDRKRKRFMDIEGAEDTPSELDLLSRVWEWSDALTRDEEVPIRDEAGHIVARVTCPVRLKVFPRITRATVGWQMTSADDNTRLKEPVFRELLFELLNNIWKYGDRLMMTEEDGEPHVQINVRVTAAAVRVAGKIVPLLVLANIIHPAKAHDCRLVAQRWTRWPENGDFRYNGPGMALEIFHRLKLGDMYYRTRSNDNNLILEVGVSFVGLHILPDPAKGQDND